MTAICEQPVTHFANRNAVGAASEYIAAAHLMRLGYHVFRAMSSSCPVDLIAWREGEQPQRVEVKSGSRNYPKTSAGRVCHSYFHPKNSEWDLLLIVDPDQRVFMYRSDETPTYDAIIVRYRAAQDALIRPVSTPDAVVRVSTTPDTFGTAERRTER